MYILFPNFATSNFSSIGFSGIFTFNNSIPSGNPFFSTIFTSFLSIFPAKLKSISTYPFSNLAWSFVNFWEIAIAGIPKLAASSAAPIVPEVVSSAFLRLKPVFIPDITMSGVSLIISNNPKVTASVGVPVTE